MLCFATPCKVRCSFEAISLSELAELLLMKGRQSAGDLMQVMPWPGPPGHPLIRPAGGPKPPGGAGPPPAAAAPKVIADAKRRKISNSLLILACIKLAAKQPVAPPAWQTFQIPQGMSIGEQSIRSLQQIRNSHADTCTRTGGPAVRPAGAPAKAPAAAGVSPARASNMSCFLFCF